ncbi:MAG: 50S ribosomal protein L24 [Candidatus Thermoplasmatota archaeon]|jgi:large subunit ribosomal protein L24|nr:50S ribosomal protein L24 [Candidatus Thermoplasmatota archaeon]MCL5984003.1 50S ribosomal protein L24 [Candidatus Thermoplasmatota archaeon]
MSTNSSLPRKQRKSLYTAHHTERRKHLALSLSRELRSRYGRRRIPVRKGDTVRVISGAYVGREERVTKVDYRHYRLVLDNITVKKADGKMKQLPIAPVHLMLTKLDLADPWRRRILKAPAEEGETPTESTEALPTEGAAGPDVAEETEEAEEKK